MKGRDTTEADEGYGKGVPRPRATISSRCADAGMPPRSQSRRQSPRMLSYLGLGEFGDFR